MVQNPKNISKEAKEIELDLLPVKSRAMCIIKNMIHLIAGKKVTG
jgi:hypothetical protein